MEKPKADINKINEIISHIAYAADVIQAAKDKVNLLDLSNTPDGEDLKKKIGNLFDDSTIKFHLVYDIIKAIYTGSVPEDKMEMIYSKN
jgi:hypothetical protein